MPGEPTLVIQTAAQLGDLFELIRAGARSGQAKGAAVNDRWTLQSDENGNQFVDVDFVVLLSANAGVLVDEEVRNESTVTETTTRKEVKTTQKVDTPERFTLSTEKNLSEVVTEHLTEREESVETVDTPERFTKSVERNIGDVVTERKTTRTAAVETVHTPSHSVVDTTKNPTTVTNTGSSGANTTHTEQQITRNEA